MAHQILQPVSGKTECSHFRAVPLAPRISGKFGLQDLCAANISAALAEVPESLTFNRTCEFVAVRRPAIAERTTGFAK